MKPQLVLLALAAGGLALRLKEAWADIPTLLLKAVPDDAFYYFQIARNVANGRNVTFDGENLTNGFHPLWAVVLAPIYLISDDGDLALHLGLTVGAFLGAGTVLFIYAIVRMLTGNRWAALSGAAFYAIHPYIIAESVNGMESSLAVFLLALTMWLYLRVVTGDQRPTYVRYVWLGVAAGLMVLARTDLVFVLPPMLLHIVVRERGRQGLAAAFGTGAAAFLVVAPWAIWSLVSFGTVIQVSGVAVPDVERQAFLAAHGSSFPTQLKQSWDETDDAFFHQLPHLFFVPRDGPRLPSLLTGAGVVGFMLLAPLAPQRCRAARQLGLLMVPAVGVILMLLFHSTIRWHVREWYYAPVGVIAAVLLGIVVNYVSSLPNGTWVGWRVEVRKRSPDGAALLAPGRWSAWTVAVVYVLVIIMLVGVYGPQRSDRWVFKLPHRVNMLEAARWLEDNTDRDARIGAFNAGIFGYFSERTVINLDGVVNEDAYKARRDGRTMEYICAHTIRYLVDLELDYAVSAQCPDDPSLEFELVTTIGERLFYFRGGQVDVLELVSVPQPQTTEHGGQD